MNTHDYQAFTETLQRSLESDPRVVGLMAAGSVAGGSHQPDEWSDHDFWLIVEPDAQAWFHTHTDWLPDSDQVVLWFREPHGGFKVVYRSGHLLEFAVSDRSIFQQAKVNDYRLLIDRDGLAADLEQMHAETKFETKPAVDLQNRSEHLAAVHHILGAPFQLIQRHEQTIL